MAWQDASMYRWDTPHVLVLPSSKKLNHCWLGWSCSGLIPPAGSKCREIEKCVFVVRPGNWLPGKPRLHSGECLSGAICMVWVGTWEYCILQLHSEARANAGLRCPGLWGVVLLGGDIKQIPQLCFCTFLLMSCVMLSCFPWVWNTGGFES